MRPRLEGWSGFPLGGMLCKGMEVCQRPGTRPLLCCCGKQLSFPSRHPRQCYVSSCQKNVNRCSLQAWAVFLQESKHKYRYMYITVCIYIYVYREIYIYIYIYIIEREGLPVPGIPQTWQIRLPDKVLHDVHNGLRLCSCTQFPPRTCGSSVRGPVLIVWRHV